MTRANSCVFSFVFGLFIAVLTGCGGDEGNDGPTGATASLSWEPVVYATPVAYTVYYGRQSSGQVSSCNYENSVDVSEPSAFITGLEFNTQYYFAVSAYTQDGQRSLCSNEGSKLTPEAPPEQTGDGPGKGTPPPGNGTPPPANCNAEHKSGNGKLDLRCIHGQD